MLLLSPPAAAAAAAAVSILIRCVISSSAELRRCRVSHAVSFGFHLNPVSFFRSSPDGAVLDQQPVVTTLLLLMASQVSCPLASP
jgi:hypothetical protein